MLSSWISGDRLNVLFLPLLGLGIGASDDGKGGFGCSLLFELLVGKKKTLEVFLVEKSSACFQTVCGQAGLVQHGLGI